MRSGHGAAKQVISSGLLSSKLSFPTWRPPPFEFFIFRLPDESESAHESYRHTVLDALKACSKSRDLETGKRIHWDAVESGVNADRYISTTLVSMYARCGSLVDARNVFDGIASPSLASWTALIAGYANNGQGEIAVELFAGLEARTGYLPDEKVFVAALMGCSDSAAKEEGIEIEDKVVKLKSLDKGMAIHAQAVQNRCSEDAFVASTLIDVYSKCGSMEDARKVFESMNSRDVVSWNSLILGYAEAGDEETALNLFARMQSEGYEPSGRTFLAALIACGNLAAKEAGKEVDGKLLKVRSLEKTSELHSLIDKTSSSAMDLFVASSLVGCYARCGSMVLARKVFDRMTRKDTVLWNSLIFGYVDNGEAAVALETFQLMQQQQKNQGFAPNARTFVAALMACSTLATTQESGVEEVLSKVKSLHCEAAAKGFQLELYVASNLVDAYAKCGSLDDARAVFEKMPCHHLVTWNSLIQGYADSGQGEQALDLFQEMQQRGFVPDAHTFSAALMACLCMATKKEDQQVLLQQNEQKVKLRCLEKAMAIHSQAAGRGYESDIFLGSILVELYAKCGSVLDARRMFDRMPFHNVVSWTSLILCYAENNQCELALELFSSMTCSPNTWALVAALTACSSVAAAHKGREIHAEICRNGAESDQFVANSLVDMYCKCGDLVIAEVLFDAMKSRNKVSWSSVMTGHARNGNTDRVFELFEQMTAEGTEPKAISCLSVLSACSHAGLVEKGKRFFSKMVSSEFVGVEPNIEHYNCMIDLLGRANLLDEAVRMAEEMPFAAKAGTWKTVLGHCWKWRNMDLGKLAFERLLSFDDKEASAYVLMSNIYKSAGMPEHESDILQKQLL